MITKASVESDKTTASKKKNKQELKNTNASNKKDTKTKSIAQIGKNFKSKSN